MPGRLDLRIVSARNLHGAAAALPGATGTFYCTVDVEQQPRQRTASARGGEPCFDSVFKFVVNAPGLAPPLVLSVYGENSVTTRDDLLGVLRIDLSKLFKGEVMDGFAPLEQVQQPPLPTAASRTSSSAPPEIRVRIMAVDFGEEKLQQQQQQQQQPLPSSSFGVGMTANGGMQGSLAADGARTQQWRNPDEVTFTGFVSSARWGLAGTPGTDVTAKVEQLLARGVFTIRAGDLPRVIGDPRDPNAREKVLSVVYS